MGRRRATCHVRQAHTARSRRLVSHHLSPAMSLCVCLGDGVDQVMWVLVLGGRLLWPRFGGAKLLYCFLPAQPSYCFYSAKPSTPPHKATLSSCECLYHLLFHAVNGYSEWCCNCCINSRNSMLARVLAAASAHHLPQFVTWHLQLPAASRTSVFSTTALLPSLTCLLHWCLFLSLGCLTSSS